MDITKLPETLTYNQVKALRNAFGHFYDQESGTKFVDAKTGFRFDNVTGFVDYLYSPEIGIPKGTSAKHIGIVLESWYETLSKAPEPTMTPAPEYAVSSNTLSPQQLEQFAKEDEAKKVLLQKADDDAKIQVETAIKKKQENWAKLQKQKLPEIPPKEAQQKIITELKGKVLYAVPDNKVPEIALSKQEEAFVKIAKADPKLFAEKLTTLIIEKNPDIPKETLEPLSRVVAVDTTQSLSDPLKKPIPTGVFAAISRTPDQIENLSNLTQAELAKTSSILTVFAENKDGVYRNLLVRSVGENITNKVLGLPETTYHLSTSQADGSYSLKFDQLQTNSFNLQQGPVSDILNNPLFSSSKSLATGEIKNLALTKIQSLPNTGLLGNISRLTNSRAFDSVAPFLGMQTQASYIGTNFFGKAITTFLPEYAPLISNLAGKLGFDIGISAIAPVATGTATEIGGAVTKGAIGRGLMAVATKIGLGSTITAIGQALGSFAPVVGNIIAFVVTGIIGKIAEKINWAKVKEWGAAIIGGVAGVIALPFVGVGAAIGIGVVATAVSAGLGAGLGGATLAGIGSGIAGFFSALGGAFLGAIGMPILVTLLVFPVVVALILFIINSGAYVVPPQSTSIMFENPYIGVDKIPSPNGPFQNSNLPINTEYTVTITAKISPLTNVRLEEKCQVAREGASPSCPDVSGSLPTPEEIGTISPSKPFSFKYSTTYSGDLFRDSLVTNTVTVTADIPEKSGITTNGSASITIGKPPSACLVLDGTWPANYKAIAQSATISLSSGFATYMSKVCSAGQKISVVFSETCPLGWRCYGAWYGGKIYLMPEAFSSGSYTLFTLAHETGHSFQYTIGLGNDLFLQYRSTISPPDICSYGNTEGNYDESFAETIGRYVSDYPTGCRTGSFKNDYPANWQFANDKIFK